MKVKSFWSNLCVPIMTSMAPFLTASTISFCSSLVLNLLNISRVRLELGDTIEDAGVRPDGSNLSDEEILLWLDEESNDIMTVVGRACAALSKMWTNIANITVGPRREELGKVAKEWSDRATESSPAADVSYQVKVLKVNPIQDPYQVRPEEDAAA